MFGFIKKCFFTGLAFLSTLTIANLLSCISMSNQEFKKRPQTVNVNSEESFTINTNKFSGSCDSINIPYANVCS